MPKSISFGVILFRSRSDESPCYVNLPAHSLSRKSQCHRSLRHARYIAVDMVDFGNRKLTVQVTLLICQLLRSHAQGLCYFNLIRLEVTLHCVSKLHRDVDAFRMSRVPARRSIRRCWFASMQYATAAIHDWRVGDDPSTLLAGR